MFELRNTLGKKKQPFLSLAEVLVRPTNERFVSIYTCGPTVYDYATIGNFSSYLMADLVKRYLIFLGYPVKHVTNITDVGHLTADADVDGSDKLEVAAKKEGQDPYQIAQKYTEQFLADAKALGVTADVWPKATDHIAEMISIIETLVQKEYAYLTNSGVYFDVSKDPQYGKLSGNTIDQLQSGARVEVHPDKKHPADFALWKLNQPNHLMQWDSPWGKGYPGWHIECSAMATKYLGEQLDIHTGGEDNIFPHHECEIAQSECAFGKPFVLFWLHRQFLTVDGQKMSKSLGNTFRLQDLLDKGFEPEDFRMLIMAAHYRSGVNFTWEAMKASRERRLHWKRLAAQLQGSGEVPSVPLLPNDPELAPLVAALNDDLQTPNAFAVIEANPSLKMFQAADQIFGLGLFEVEIVENDITVKLQQLDALRASKEFAKADAVRAEIIAEGYDVLTTPQGSTAQKV